MIAGTFHTCDPSATAVGSTGRTWDKPANVGFPPANGGVSQTGGLQGLSANRWRTCDKRNTLRSALASVIATALLAHSAPAESHVAGCHTRDCDRRIHEKRRAHWKRTHPWLYRWHHLSTHERSWARCISFHESGNRRVARESAHWSYFQWSLPTWHAAGGSGNPEVSAGWFEQAVRAVRWAHRAGSSQWTTSGTCGGV